MNKNNILNFIESKLSDSENEDVGLFNGMISECLFYYLLGKVYDEQKYANIGDEKIDIVLEKISNNITALDFKNGLTGIGWFIEHLVQLDFLEGDTNEILENIDDSLFKYLSSNSSPVQKIDELLGYGFYVVKRLANTKKTDLEITSILKELLILIINKISENIDQGYIIISEPVSFYSAWSLPLLLIFFKKVLVLDLYNYKIVNIIRHQLFPSLITFIPRLDVNKFYLLLAINQLNKSVKIIELVEFANVLQLNLDHEKILSTDFREMDIMIMNGAAGLFLLTEFAFRDDSLCKEIMFQEKLINKIIASKYWDRVNKEDSLSINDRSFFVGICGLGIALLSNKLNKKELANE